MTVQASVKLFLKNWTLPVAIVSGVVGYLLYARLHCLDFTRPYAGKAVSVVQPVLIFCMLFLSFLKVDGKALRPRLVHLHLLLFQSLSFVAICLLLYFLPSLPGRVWLESAMLCLICPTATAAAIVTQKLHGDAADVTMYTIIVNLACALLIPAFVPLLAERAEQTFLAAFLLILAKVFPMLICPLIAAQCVRHYFPRLCGKFLSVRDLAFHLWAFSLSIAIAVTTRSIAHTDHSWFELAGIAVVSLLCCALQFALGAWLGRRCGRRISTCQSLGQKNTVFAIWMGYTFLNPVTSLAGGFYSVWHNVYNTIQLRAVSRRETVGNNGKSDVSEQA